MTCSPPSPCIYSCLSLALQRLEQHRGLPQQSRLAFPDTRFCSLAGGMHGLCLTFDLRGRFLLATSDDDPYELSSFWKMSAPTASREALSDATTRGVRWHPGKSSCGRFAAMCFLRASRSF